MTTARELLEWNGVLPSVDVLQEETVGATATFMVRADYGWAQRILCSGCYRQDALAIEAALNEAMRPDGG